MPRLLEGWHGTLIHAFERGVKGRRTFDYWADLDASQWLDGAALEHRQLLALRNLLSHARDRCTYYRQSWHDLSLQPESIDSLRDFERWPVVERETFGAEAAGIRAEAPGLRRMAKATGGSTGTPLHFELDDRSYEKRVAGSFRGYSWAGARPGSRQVHLWGTSLAPEPARVRLKMGLYNWLYNRRVLGAFGLSDSTTAEYLRRMEAFRPEVVVAYANALYAFSRSLRDQGLVPPSPRSIVVGAEKLHPFQRELIEEVFRAPVFETYGSREFMLMAAQCERRGGLHVTAENLLVEVVDEAGRRVPDGVEGRVVVTDLFNYAMPFIRYANGDRAVAGGDCGCGRGLPLLAAIAGREADILTTPDGRRVSGLLFPHLLKDFRAVRRFQVVQERPDEVVLKLEAPGASEEDMMRIRAAAVSILGLTIQVRLELVSEIALGPSAKLQVVVNKLERQRAGTGGAAG